MKETIKIASCPTPYEPSVRLVLTITTLATLVSTTIETRSLRLPELPGVGRTISASVVGDVEARRRYPMLPAYLTSSALLDVPRGRFWQNTVRLMEAEGGEGGEGSADHVCCRFFYIQSGEGIQRE